MARVLICDVCEKRTDKIATKLYLAPVTEGNGRATHSNYTAHLDVGTCCADRIVRLGKWRKRQAQPRKEAKRK